MTNRRNDDSFSLDALGRFAEQTARAVTPGKPVSTAAAVTAGQHMLADVKSVMLLGTAYADKHDTVPQALEWLLDNWYIAEREGKSAITDLKAIRRLRADARGRGGLVIKAASDAFVQYCLGAVDGERMGVFLDRFQDARCLTEAELGAFIPALRLSLIGALAAACRRLRAVLTDGATSDELPEAFCRCFTSLRFLAGFDASGVLENVNRVEQTLRLDPAGVYAQMDEHTRCAYRRDVARLAAKTGDSAAKTAEKVFKLAENASKHVGWYIYAEPLGTPTKKRNGGFYIALIVLGSLFLSLLISFALDLPAISVLLLLPISEVIKNITDYIILRVEPPRRIMRLELDGGVPDEGRTLCTISLLLSSPESGERAARLLEEYRHANRDAGSNLLFGILADLPDATALTHPDDDIALQRTRAVIDTLNSRFGGGFFLFSRDRQYNPRDKKYTVWERKRGAVLELCRLLCARPTGLHRIAGDPLQLKNVRYVLTLDGDTRLCAGAARELVGAAMHPLNTPVVDRVRGIVTQGCGILQPRISVDLTAANQTLYARIFAGQGGIDPYGGVTGDIYQNLFGTGSFAGKGLIDVRAYLDCLDNRFPENIVLSHDLLEGAYLRCRLAGDIELTDGFPGKVTTYYDRLHRWTRGDWQSLPWLGRRVRGADGLKTRNVLGQLDRWKIADNLRRSLVGVFTMASLILAMLFDNSDFLWVSLVAVLSVLSHLFITSAVEMFNRHRRRVRYHSAVVSGIGGQLVQTLIKLILLPYEAWISLSAAITALYRMRISRRDLLAWVTAADSERLSKNSVLFVFKRMWPAILGSVLIAVFTPFISAWIVTIVWALSPLLVQWLSRPVRRDNAPSVEDKMTLTRMAGDIWRYFDELLTPDDNYLPPDNFQEQPAVGVAHRTSPTNIGLALLSALAAVDLGACKAPRAVWLISNMLETIRRLPKWNGHLYNWYDTTTLQILQPSYVSTVDSGNFAGCLIVLREGLIELGEHDLAADVQKLLDAMSFRPLYDEKRRLFYIGLDLTRGQPTEGWYDLLASEARQTSYIAVARGDVPRKHWRRLGRALVSKDGYRGMASWTGTMFEYFMPELLLPCYENSLIYESLKFCLYVQKKSAHDIPWGMSESAFYAFDHTLSYRYKAHGVQRLALKRGMGREAVVSPYSTFLALPLDPRSAMRNLRRLNALDMDGRYGLCEAADFTPARQRGGRYEVVRTYMAHHLGMSLVAIDNVLRGGIMQQRFLRDREMAAFTELLQEKVPVGGLVLRRTPRDVPEKPSRAPDERWGKVCDNIDTRNPSCAVLSNGAYTVVCAETGQTRSVWNAVTLTRASPDATGQQAGIAFFLKTDNALIPLQPAPMFDDSIDYSAVLSGASCRISAKKDGIDAAVTVSVPENETGELRVVELTASAAMDGELICYLEPVLSPLGDYLSHPAFSKLSLETMAVDGTVVVKRRPRGRGRGIALAFGCDSPYTFDTSREKALGRGGLLSLPSALSREADETTGAVLDPCVLARVPVRLTPGAVTRVRFAMTTAARPESAATAARRLACADASTVYSRLDELARRLGLTAGETERAMALVTPVLYPSPDRHIGEKATAALRRGQQGLWPLGISGDLPVVSVVIDSQNDIERYDWLVPAHRLLGDSGVAFDLVYLVSGGGDYHSRLRGSLLEALRARLSDLRLETRGGVHIVNVPSDGAETVRAVSVRVFTPDLDADAPERDDSSPPAPRRFYPAVASRSLTHHYNDDNSFTFDMDGRLPLNAWSHLLSNGTYGYIATDAGTGHMWYLNARENPINRWLNDSLTTSGTEHLCLLTDDSPVSLFAEPDGRHCSITYGFGWACWRKTIGSVTVTTTAFVPSGTAARVLLVETDAAAPVRISYDTDLVLAPDPASSVYVETVRRGVFITARNPYNTDFPDTVFLLTASSEPTAFTCAAASRDADRFDGKTGVGFSPCAAAVYTVTGPLVIVTGCAAPDALRALADPDAARRALDETLKNWQQITSKLVVHTPDAHLNHYLNGWATYQTLACRVLGRSSLYQSGGAYGFRDQLQDVCAIVDEAPDIARAHLTRAARHQFLEGDVQHWWHPGAKLNDGKSDKGVRTRCSDDLLWLPYALCTYADMTGDMSVYRDCAPYITAVPLADGEDERYEQPKISDVSETLLRHAIRAADLFLQRGTGHHGLALMGTGDWNDGMNLVGAGGAGESVWLTWFGAVTLGKLSDACAQSDNTAAATRFLEAADALREAAEDAWDGDWYRRGYYDSGAPLGSCTSDECAIDSIAQSFAALAGADAAKTKTALRASIERLYDPQTRLVRLFDPPFSHGLSKPGYIKGYSPGFRENGGQYTHGAVWLAMGLFLEGMTDEGWEISRALLPQGRPDDIYRTEPYVMAADVYSAPGHVGRGGWTWYTGAAGWYKRVALENLLGLRLIGGELHVRPTLPSGWSGYSADWTQEDTTYHIAVDAAGVATITTSGKAPKTPSVVIENDAAVTNSNNSQ